MRAGLRRQQEGMTIRGKDDDIEQGRSEAETPDMMTELIDSQNAANTDDDSMMFLRSHNSLALANQDCVECSPISDGSSLNLSFNRSNVIYRSLRPGDKANIKRLHEEWFPVSYKDDFYEELSKHRMIGSGEKLFSCVACSSQQDATYFTGYSASGNGYHTVLPHVTEESVPSLSSSSSSWTTKNGSAEPFMYKQPSPTEMVHNAAVTPTSNNNDPTVTELSNYDDERIVGCVVGCFVDVARSSCAETSSLLISNPSRHKKMFYIMTLGIESDFRKMGLGSQLVNKCVEWVEQEPQCGALYLHVITYNQAAIRLYEKNRFVKVKEIEGYYAIDGKDYNCYLYARYFHGNRGHFTILQFISTTVYSVWKSVTRPILSVFMDLE